MGTATAPGGHTLTLDSRSLLRDGRPWVLISGEFHFSRCPESEWRDELLKMKAGGVSVVASYIFWIHHEEVEGAWDWTGQRNLRKFLETCQEVGLNVLLRIGPWCHGEVRNGGFPNWLQKMGDDKVFELRRDNPGYLGYVTKLYGQIGQQTKGLLWKDGGPVIAIQLENEYSGPTQHLMTLKQIARDAGMDVPLYTCTGWGSGGAAPFGEIVPFSGSYVDGFWDRSLSGGRLWGRSPIFRVARRQCGGDGHARRRSGRDERGPGKHGCQGCLSLLHLRTRRRHDAELSPARFHVPGGHRIPGPGQTRLGCESPGFLHVSRRRKSRRQTDQPQRDAGDQLLE